MLKEFTEAQAESNEQATYSLYGAKKTGVSASDVQTGFIPEEMSELSDEEGNTKSGSIYEREGFLSPIGYKFNTR